MSDPSKEQILNFQYILRFFDLDLNKISDFYRFSEGKTSIVFIFVFDKEEYAMKVIDDVHEHDLRDEFSYNCALSKLGVCPKYLHSSVFKNVNFDRNLEYTSDQTTGVLINKFIEDSIFDKVTEKPIKVLESIFSTIDRFSITGLVHIDIKPSNMRFENGSILLIDFTSEWVKRKLKTCECIEKLVFPLCDCNTKSKKLNMFFMKLIFSILFCLGCSKKKTSPSILNFIACSFNKTFRILDDDENLYTDVLKVLNCDLDVKHIFVHYLFSSDWDTKKKLFASDICEVFFKSLQTSLCKNDMSYIEFENIVRSVRKKYI